MGASFRQSHSSPPSFSLLRWVVSVLNVMMGVIFFLFSPLATFYCLSYHSLQVARWAILVGHLAALWFFGLPIVYVAISFCLSIYLTDRPGEWERDFWGFWLRLLFFVVVMGIGGILFYVYWKGSWDSLYVLAERIVKYWGRLGLSGQEGLGIWRFSVPLFGLVDWVLWAGPFWVVGLVLSIVWLNMGIWVHFGGRGFLKAEVLRAVPLLPFWVGIFSLLGIGIYFLVAAGGVVEELSGDVGKVILIFLGLVEVLNTFLLIQAFSHLSYYLNSRGMGWGGRTLIYGVLWFFGRFVMVVFGAWLSLQGAWLRIKQKQEE